MLIIVGSFLGIFIRSRSEKWAIRVAKIGGLAGLMVVVLGFISNAKSDTPVWGQEPKVYIAAALAPIIGLCFGLAIAMLLRFPKPSVVAISLECGVQNKVLALSVIGISLKGHDKSEAAAMPLIYGLFAIGINVMWGFSAWKCLGWTHLDRSMGIFEACKNRKNYAEEERLSVSVFCGTFSFLGLTFPTSHCFNFFIYHRMERIYGHPAWNSQR